MIARHFWKGMLSDMQLFSHCHDKHSLSFMLSVIKASTTTTEHTVHDPICSSKADNSCADENKLL